MVAIKSHFDGKVFVPDEPVDVPRGQSVVLHVFPSAETNRPVARQHLLDWVVENLTARTDLPPDGAEQHDHYLYGTPKRPQK